MTTVFVKQPLALPRSAKKLGYTLGGNIQSKLQLVVNYFHGCRGARENLKLVQKG